MDENEVGQVLTALGQEFQGVSLADHHITPQYVAHLSGFCAEPGTAPAKVHERVMRKLRTSVRWRLDNNVNALGYDEVAASLAPNHMRWEPCGPGGRPVLFVFPSKMDLATYNRHNYKMAHVFLIEQGLRALRDLAPDGSAHTFCVCANAHHLGLRHLDLRLMRSLLELLTQLYPARVDGIFVWPVNTVVTACWKALSAAMPARLRGKIRILKPGELGEVAKGLGGSAELPEWWTEQRGAARSSVRVRVEEIVVDANGAPQQQGGAV